MLSLIIDSKDVGKELDSSFGKTFNTLQKSDFLIPPWTERTFWNNMKNPLFAERYLTVVLNSLSVTSLTPEGQETIKIKDIPPFAYPSMLSLLFIAISYNRPIRKCLWESSIQPIVDTQIPILVDGANFLKQILDREFFSIDRYLDIITEKNELPIFHDSLPLFSFYGLIRLMRTEPQQAEQLFLSIHKKISNSININVSFIYLHLFEVMITFFPTLGIQFRPILTQFLSLLTELITFPYPLSQKAADFGIALEMEKTYPGFLFYNILLTSSKNNSSFDSQIPVLFDSQNKFVPNYIYNSFPISQSLQQSFIQFARFYIFSKFRSNKTFTIPELFDFLKHLSFSKKSTNTLREKYNLENEPDELFEGTSAMSQIKLYHRSRHSVVDEKDLIVNYDDLSNSQTNSKSDSDSPDIRFRRNQSKRSQRSKSSTNSGMANRNISTNKDLNGSKTDSEENKQSENASSTKDSSSCNSVNETSILPDNTTNEEKSTQQSNSCLSDLSDTPIENQVDHLEEIQSNPSDKKGDDYSDSSQSSLSSDSDYDSFEYHSKPKSSREHRSINLEISPFPPSEIEIESHIKLSPSDGSDILTPPSSNSPANSLPDFSSSIPIEPSSISIPDPVIESDSAIKSPSHSTREKSKNTKKKDSKTELRAGYKGSLLLPTVPMIEQRLALNVPFSFAMTIPHSNDTVIFVTPTTSILTATIFKPIAQMTSCEENSFKILVLGEDFMLSNIVLAYIDACTTHSFIQKCHLVYNIVTTNSSNQNLLASYIASRDPIYSKFVHNSYSTVSQIGPVFDESSRVAFYGVEEAWSQFENNVWFCEPSPSTLFQFSLYHYILFARETVDVCVWKCVIESDESKPQQILVPFISSLALDLGDHPRPLLITEKPVSGKGMSKTPMKIGMLSLYNVNEDLKISPNDECLALEMSSEMLSLQNAESRLQNAKKVNFDLVESIDIEGDKVPLSIHIVADGQKIGPVRKIKITKMPEPGTPNKPMKIKIASFIPVN